MRPALKPGLRRVWRDDHTVQIGTDPDCATLLTGIDHALAHIIESLTGTRTADAVITYGATMGVPAHRTRRLLELLRECGVLDDGDRSEAALRGLRPTERERLRPDLLAASISSGRLDGGTDTLTRRRRAHIAVHGAGRVGASIASLLAAAGIGQVTVLDPYPVEPADLAPAGHDADHLGMSRAAAAMQRIRQIAPRSRRSRDDWLDIARGSARPDLVVLAPDDAVDRSLGAQLVRDGVAHLVAGVHEIRGVVGPLVIPGVTSCLRCLDLHRGSRDPDWPTMMQAMRTSNLPTRAVDVVLASTVAGIAALHVLAFLDERLPPSVDGTIELLLPFGVARRRTRAAHPGCGCQWSHLVGTESATEPVADAHNLVPS